MSKFVGVEERRLQDALAKHGSDLSQVVEAIVAAGRYDEPQLLSQLPNGVFQASRYFQEWMKPRQIIDILSLDLLVTPTRYASLGMSRHESMGFSAQREIERATLLLPHLRRAVMISDVLDLRTIERERMAQALDALRCGVVLIDTRATILYANRSAEGMLRKGEGAIQALAGRFMVKAASATRELGAAIKLASQDETSIGKTGLAIRLTEVGENPIFAHVLPLTGSELRTRLQPAAVAAVFIGVSPDTQDAATAAAAAYDLTRAETRVLASLLGGCTLVETAAALGIAPTTAKSHLEHIFAKSGVARQADLMRLATGLTPPIGSSSAN